MDDTWKAGLKAQATRIKSEERNLAFSREHGSPDAWHRDHRHLEVEERKRLYRALAQAAADKQRAEQWQHIAAFVGGMAIVHGQADHIKGPDAPPQESQSVPTEDHG